MRKITSRFPGLKILLIEDYFINQEVTKDILEYMDCNVEIAESGKTALEMYQGEKYDVIFMDIQMPDMDGFEVTRHIRKLSPNLSRPIIIALTANVLNDAKEKCLNAGMNDFIAKPMEAEKLEDMLKKFFPTKIANA